MLKRHEGKGGRVGTMSKIKFTYIYGGLLYKWSKIGEKSPTDYLIHRINYREGGDIGLFITLVSKVL